MPVADLCCSFLIRTTLQFLALLRSNHAALQLSMFLLSDLCYSVPLYDTKRRPDNIEELILDAKIKDEQG